MIHIREDDGQGNGLLRRFRRVLLIAGMVLGVDLAFSACADRQENTEVLLLQEDTQEESSEGDGVDTVQSREGDSVTEEEMSSLVTVTDGAQEPEEGAEGESGTQTGGEDDGAAQDPAEQIYVYVCGAVASPGVYAFPDGTRVYEAVAAAGGFTENADESYVNQALILLDQDRLNIPTQEEAAALMAGDTALSGYGIISSVSAGGTVSVSGTEISSGDSSDTAEGLVNINTASQEELESLPGIGAAKAAAIIAYRQENGDFASAEEIQNVSGIGEATYEGLAELITV